MDIPNLSTDKLKASQSEINFSLLPIIIVVVLALVSGFWISRFFPLNKAGDTKTTTTNQDTLSTDKISSAEDLKVGKVYGNSEKNFKDSAIGLIEKGSINGEGTHILVREGGLSQRASLISSTVDLDLFVGKKVEIKGETNASNKTSWLLDVGSLKVLE
jgi:hypothetical protein